MSAVCLHTRAAHMPTLLLLCATPRSAGPLDAFMAPVPSASHGLSRGGARLGRGPAGFRLRQQSISLVAEHLFTQ